MIDVGHHRFERYCAGKHPHKVPAKPGTKLQLATEQEHLEAKHLPYMSLQGLLIFLITWCRCECSTIVSMLGTHMANWSKAHFDQAIEVLMYLVGTKHHGIKWTMNWDSHGVNILWAMSDADLAGDPKTGRSRTGKLVMMNGGPIIVRSTLQTTVQLSTCAAEIVALSDVALDTLAIVNLLNEIGINQANATTIYEDNNMHTQYAKDGGMLTACESRTVATASCAD